MRHLEGKKDADTHRLEDKEDSDMRHLEDKEGADIHHLEDTENADTHRSEDKKCRHAPFRRQRGCRRAAFGRHSGSTWCISSDVVVMGNNGRCKATSASTHPRDHTSIPVPHAPPVKACTGHTRELA